MSRLKNKVAVVTGGSDGIGLGIVRRFVQEGAYVFATGRRKEMLDRLADEIGERGTAIQSDAADLEDLERLFETVKSAKGHLDILVVNAGKPGFALLDQVTPEQFDNVYALNVRGALFTVQKALPILNEGASIILIGSMVSAMGLPGMTVYASTKAALRSFARTWTAELKDRRIRTNVLSLGPVLTPRIAAAPGVAERVVATVPLGRAASVEEVAAMALFLASDDSAFVAGAELFADGGAAQV
ncbi:MAG TPA: SDR family oxidoreductase [Allosphingosinicella sp.]|nr:SDR family oxidoreductase [Allosphingosinicella sp.]